MQASRCAISISSHRAAIYHTVPEILDFLGGTWSHVLRPKESYANVAVPSAPVRVPSQRPLALSVTSVKSVG